MTRFQNVLLALDVDEERIADTGLVAAEQAFRVARAHGASVTLVHVFDVSEKLRDEMLQSPDSAAGRHYRAVQGMLEELAATAQGIPVQTRLLFGTHWRELVREVQRAQHDLVVLGTKRRSVAGRTLFGSTGNKLLRSCPCPVWIVKAPTADRVQRILVAHDMTAVGSAALQIGATIAAIEHGELHVLHVLEHPESKHFLSSVDADVRESRAQTAQQSLAAQCREFVLESEPVISVRDGTAYAVILDCARSEAVDLLVMGTVARSGLAALLTGNTAENVLPWADCSLVAIKPADFVSPVTA